MSEYEPGVSPRLHHFLVRNRIVSGLSDVLIITEASERSGTMNTVTHALAQGKDIYVVPGNITSPTSRGCNRLIAQGAIPIVDIDESTGRALAIERVAEVFVPPVSAEAAPKEVISNQ